MRHKTKDILTVKSADYKNNKNAVTESKKKIKWKHLIIYITAAIIGSLIGHFFHPFHKILP